MTVPPPSRSLGRLGPSRIRELLDLVERDDVLSLAGGLPAPSTFDRERVRAAALAALDRDGPLGPAALQYGPTAGMSGLRELLADRTGVPVSSTLVTTGSQQALDLLARTVCDPGSVVVVQAPAYLGAVQAFRAAGARVVGLRGDRHGIDVDALEAALAGGLRPVALHVVAEFHNPTGAVLAEERRRRLLELCDRHGVLVVDDGAYRDLRFAGVSPTPLGDLGPGVLTLGSASKVLAPGLRVGWATGPASVLEGMIRMKQAADLHTPALNQLIVAELLGDRPAHQAHLGRLRSRYRTSAELLTRALADHLGDRLAVDPAQGGMFLWARAEPAGPTGDDLLTAALAEGVAFVPGAAFDLPGHDQGAVPDPGDGPWARHLRLSHATVPLDHLDEAARRLARAWDRAGAHRTPMSVV